MKGFESTADCSSKVTVKLQFHHQGPAAAGPSVFVQAGQLWASVRTQNQSAANRN